MKKRNAKKNTNKKAPKYGYNVYGERCIVKEVEIQKENVLEQYTVIVDDIDAHQQKGIALEYTVTHSKDFTEEEIKYYGERFSLIMAFRAQIRGTRFETAHITLPNAS